jgi:DnaJ-class molecular chaperone
MTADWERYNFYRTLEVEAHATVQEIENACRHLTSTIDPDGKPDERKREAAVGFVAANAALEVLSDEGSRRDYDEKIKEVQKAASAKEKIEEGKAAGTAVDR